MSETEVTPEWLKSIGFKWKLGKCLEVLRPDPLEHIGVRYTVSFDRLWLRYGDSASCLYDNPTRADVVKLCEALGIPLAITNPSPSPVNRVD